MSVEAITYVIDRAGLPSGAKLLYVVIANSADHAGIAYPGRELLAARCCFSRRTVTTQMAYLEARNEIARFERRRQNGSRTSDWIVLAPNAKRAPMLDADASEYPPDVVAAATSGEESSPEDVGGSQVKFVQGQVKQASRPDPSVDPSVEPSGPPDPPKGGRQRDANRYLQQLTRWIAAELPEYDASSETTIKAVEQGLGAGHRAPAAMRAFLQQWWPQL